MPVVTEINSNPLILISFWEVEDYFKAPKVIYGSKHLLLFQL